MDKVYTPTKETKSAMRNTAAQSYVRKTPEPPIRPDPAVATTRTPASELAALRDYESLKIQVRQLQAKNRSLSSEVEQLLYEKSYSENKFMQKMNFEEETLSQFHKEKNYQMELLQIKHEEEMSRLKRESELRADQFLREIKHKDYQIKEKDEQNRYLEMRNEEIRGDYDTLDRELLKSREQSSILTDKLTSCEFANKKLEMLVEELEIQKSEMESEIRTLLDIESEKTRAIHSLEMQLTNSENNERRLTDKLNVLTDNFAELEDHIAIMKQKLLSADEDNHHLVQKLERCEMDLREKENLILEQSDRESQLRVEVEEHQKRESRREREVAELMAENERLYRELNVTRHRLHDFGIAYGVDV